MHEGAILDKIFITVFIVLGSIAILGLFMLAVGILNLPSSSASVERSFSQHSNINSLPRNRLTNQRAAKLLFISHNFKVINPKNNQKKNIALDYNEEKEFEESNEVEPETDAESDDVFELSEVNPSQIEALLREQICLI